MTCKNLKCLLFGHKWIDELVFRAYSAKGYELNRDYRTSEEGVGAPSTGFQLFCMRSRKWTKVSRKKFDRFYERFCHPQPEGYYLSTVPDRDSEVVDDAETEESTEGRCYYGSGEGPDFGDY